MSLCNPVKYEARLEDGTVIAKSDGVEFTVQEGIFMNIRRYIYEYGASWRKCLCLLDCTTNKMAYLGHFCPALSKAVKTMKKGEKVLLTVKPQCKGVTAFNQDSRLETYVTS